MRLSLALLSLGLLLLALGVTRSDEPELPLPLRQRLNGELSNLRSKGHAAELLVSSGHSEELSAKARARARETGATVIAVSADAADFVPSPKDTQIADPAHWTAVARHVAWPYLRNDDVGGAASALVRAYSANLIARGQYPAQPPLPPIFLPDITRSQRRSIDVHLSGFGIVLVIMGLANFLAGRRTRRATNQ
jgi:hypothetical protein